MDKIFILKNSNLQRIQVELRFFFSAGYTSSNDALYLYQFHENILAGMKVIDGTRFSLKQFQMGICCCFTSTVNI